MLVFCWSSFLWNGPKDELPQILIGIFQIFFAQVHHMATEIPFEIQPVSHFTTWVHLPHGILSIKISGCTIEVATLYQDVEIWVLSHCLAKLSSRIVPAAIPGVNRSEHVVLQVSFESELILNVMIYRGSEGM